MADSLSKKQKSFNMSKIRSKGNFTTEKTFRKLLQSNGIKGWRRQTPLPGKPDFVFSKKKAVVFVDGCFWHGCTQCANKTPTSNVSFWTKKITSNKIRDRKINRKLRALGWKVLRLWEHEIKKKNEKYFERLTSLLLKRKGSGPYNRPALRDAIGHAEKKKI